MDKMVITQTFTMARWQIVVKKSEATNKPKTKTTTKQKAKQNKQKQKREGGGGAHLLSATVRVYSLVAPCRLSDLTSLALLGSVSGQRRLSRGPLPGYKTVSKWRLQLQDSIPFLLLSQRLCTTLHTSASLGCYLLFTHMPDCPLAPLGQV